MFKEINTNNSHIQDMLSHIRREFNEREKKSSLYYNFDFLKGHPLETRDENARFEWTSIKRSSKEDASTTSSPTLHKNRYPTQGREVSLFGVSKNEVDNY